MNSLLFPHFQTNIARIRAADIVLDPFVGTGGLILPAAEFGAFVLGTEINYQTAKAKGRSSRQGVGERGEEESILANFEQQGTEVSGKFEYFEKLGDFRPCCFQFSSLTRVNTEFGAKMPNLMQLLQIVSWKTEISKIFKFSALRSSWKSQENGEK